MGKSKQGKQTKKDERETQGTRDGQETRSRKRRKPDKALKEINELTNLNIEHGKNKEKSRTDINIIRVSKINTTNRFLSEVNKRNMGEINNTLRELSTADLDYPYTGVEILTTAELQLFNFMKNNLYNIDRVEIMVKVRVADLIKVDNRLSADRDKKFLYSITNKHVDYVICEKGTMHVICVVELDDYTHEAKDRKAKDEFVMRALGAAGIKTYRIKVRISTIEKSDLRDIEKEINTYFAPNCPVCGKRMKPKENRKNGHRFYGCDNKECKRTIDIDVMGERLP